MSRTSLLVTTAIASAVVGFFVHTAWDHYSERQKPIVAAAASEELHLGMKGFVNPLLDCGPGSISSLKESQIREAVEKFIAESKSKGLAGTISVYYRDLNNGPTFGIDSQELFTPASLLKVPVMIAVQRRAEEDPKLI
ncbi:MAG: serine hydrolase, partial [Bdellovibrionota bacterium]